MTKLQVRIAIIVGAVSGLTAMACIFLISPATGFLAVTNCHADEVYSSLQTCTPLSNGWSIIQRLVLYVGFFGIPLLLGTWFGVRYAYGNEKFATVVIMVLVAMVAYLALASTAEVIILQAWDNVPYNRYTLDAIFGTVWSIFFLFISIVGVSISAVFSRRFWSNFKPLGFLNSQKPHS